MRQTLEKKTEFSSSTLDLVVNFKSAYDRIKRNAPFKAMEEFGISAELVRLTKVPSKTVK
jgi:hypothetical protein